MKRFSLYIIVLFVTTNTIESAAQNETHSAFIYDLKESDWFYNKKGDTKKYFLVNKWPEAYMGTKYILDPLKEFNADSLQWMENAEWEYSTKIKISNNFEIGINFIVN